MSMPSPRRTTRGFTLVELAVAIVIIGVLAAFAVPRFMSTVERSKAAEAYNYLSTLAAAQERYHAREGTYSSKLDDLDISLPNPEFFSIGKIAVPKSLKNLEEGWELPLTRSGSSGGYGAYTVVFNQDGYDAKLSTITDEISPLKTKK